MRRGSISRRVVVGLLVLGAASGAVRVASDHTSAGSSATRAGFAPAGNLSAGGSAATAGRRIDTAHRVSPPREIKEAKHDVSPPLRTLKSKPVAPFRERKEKEQRPRPVVSPVAGVDGALDTTTASSMPAATSFLGMTNLDGYYPPDTNGDVGPNHYVETDNIRYAIYNKAGTQLVAPTATNTLFTGFGGLCETTNEGDPIVQYDQFADRWLISQFAFGFDIHGDPVGPYYECIAISTTADPTGSYYRYAFQISTHEMDDYPKIGIWRDGYYMSVNQFDDDTGGGFSGAGAVVFKRSAMLTGVAATGVYFDLSSAFYSLLPADVDGPTLPADGVPAPFIQFDDTAQGYAQDQLEVWKFHVDWDSPGSSTFTTEGSLATSAFDSNMCNYARACIAQPSTTSKLDAISDRLMYRLAYRRFSDHSSLVVNQTVDTNAADHAGVRWYELRKTTGNWSIYQQGTYTPDAVNRWMGSAAMDKDGNLAIGYAAGSGTVSPGIRYAGRLAGDTLGTLAQGEATLIAGAGSQTATGSRWGDYSSLSVDPTDDCTFWYAQEYYTATSAATWATRIGHFKFPSCGTQPTITGFTPATGGTGSTVTITGTNFTGATAVSVTFVPASFTVVNSTTITATVPANIPNPGKWRVTTPAGTAASSTLFTSTAPTVTGFTPSSGPNGATVTLTGTNFTGATQVSLYFVNATFTVVNSTTITAQVPEGVPGPGKWRVTTPNGMGTSPTQFTPTAPLVSGFTPLSGPSGATVTITGSNFTGATQVTLYFRPATFTVVNSTTITAQVPVDVPGPGKWRVTTPAGTGASPTQFAPTSPAVTSFTPSSGGVGTTVTITGINFTGATAVTLYFVPATFTVVNSTTITATVPAGVPGPGRWRVTTPLGVGTSANQFTVT